MIYRALQFIAVLACGCLPLAGQVPIPWNSPPDAVNLDSDGQPMDAGYTFELGVFNGSFTPTLENIDLWVANWSVAGSETNPASTSYVVSTKRYAAQHDADNNDAPFDVGKPGYVWGKRESAGGKQWILFRATNWDWPSTFPPGPTLTPWVADQATAVIGQINPTGTPFLMKSAAAPFSWTEWQAANLSGEPLNGPLDDPDKDGTPNLLEFVFASTPTVSNPPTPTPVTLQSGHVVITIPRRIDRLATLTVEVSGNLADWQSGPAHTEVLQNDQAALVVRDLTPLSPANPKRFIRLKVTLP
jgi:hypothetical protein